MSVLRRGSSTAVAAGGAGGLRRRHLYAPNPMATAARVKPIAGTSQVAFAFGSASTRSPNCATNAVLISDFDLHWSTSPWMNARSRLADGASSATFSGTPHWRHITSSATSEVDVFGHAEAGEAKARKATTARSFTRAPSEAAPPSA